MKVGDLVTIDKFCAPPELYGLGVVSEIIQTHDVTGKPLRARVYWCGHDLGPRYGKCAVRYLHKAEIK